MASKKTTPPDKASEQKPAATSVIDDPWQSKTEIIRRFLEQQSDFQQLCNEVEYTLSKLLRKANVKVSAVTSRTKTLESFLEKVQRKSYGDPFAEITDFAGVRVVCLFPDDLPLVGKLISDEFTIVEGPETARADDIERFGYSADHYIVRLGKNTSGARYDDLKKRVSEIQVRTVLQDAWAILSHHLLYKQEKQVPRELQRGIRSLAGALESADFMYQVIRDRRNAYISSISESTTSDALDRVPTNLDSLAEYFRRTFPDRPLGVDSDHLSLIVREANLVTNCPTLKDIDDLMNRTKKSREFLTAAFGDTQLPAAAELFRAVEVVHPDWDPSHFPESIQSTFERARKLLEATPGPSTAPP